MASRTRSGRSTKPPERYVPVETITDDFNDEEYDSDDPYGTKESDFEDEPIDDEDDEEDDDDDEGSLKDFIADDEDDEENDDIEEDEFLDDD